MSDERVVVEAPCGHGSVTQHYIFAYGHEAGRWCQGGTHRELTPGEYVLVEKVNGEWPEWSKQALLALDLRHNRVLDALASKETK